MDLLHILNPYADIDLSSLDPCAASSELPPNAHLAYLNILLGNDCIDLVAARKQLNRYIKSKRPKKLWIPLLALYVVVLAFPAVYLTLEVRRVEVDIDSINEYINSPTVAERLAELNALSQETASYLEIVRQTEEKTAWENTMPKASSNMLDSIILLHGKDVLVTNFTFDDSAGLVRISANCANAHVSADYVDVLYGLGIAREVVYTGYGSGGDGRFTFSVDVTLNAEGDE
jgi:hypothetical protein